MRVRLAMNFVIFFQRKDSRNVKQGMSNLFRDQMHHVNLNDQENVTRKLRTCDSVSL